MVSQQPQPTSAKDVVATMMANEEAAAKVKANYTYVNQERSERTGGHLWTEKVVETSAGKIRMLREEDGQPLSADRIAQERGRLATIVANPAAFQRHEQAIKGDEAHSRQMVTTLPRAFLLSEPKRQGEYLRIDFRPNPAYSPQSMEERVMQGMSGFMLVDPASLRLHHIEGRLASDITIGFGFLATIRAGSNFATTRELVGNPDALEWKTALVDADIDGKAIFFKAISKKQHAEHTNFMRVPNDLSVAQAVELVER